MEWLIGLVVFVVFVVVPVMFGARVVGARNTGFGHALLAVIVVAVVSALVAGLIGNDIISLIATAAVGAFIFAGILGTTFLRGLAISVIATIIQWVVLFLLAGIIVGTGVATA